MPDWKDYERKAREWYIRHKKQIYVATASSFMLMLITSILEFTTELISTELFFIILLGSFTCTMVLLLLIMFGEERYFEFMPSTR